MKSRIVIAFMSLMLITTIVAPSVYTLLDVDLQTALVDSTEGEEKKQAKEKEFEEKKLISEFALVDLKNQDYWALRSSEHLLAKHFALLQEVPLPPPELQA
ncbi:MAG: hypothetical protein ABJM06_05870 [Gilvibacter sp.]